MESKLEAKLKRKVEALGGKCYKWVSPGTRGIPDRLIIMPDGGIHFVETKWGKNGLSPQQKLIQKIFNSFGLKVHVIATEDQLNNFINLLDLL